MSSRGNVRIGAAALALALMGCAGARGARKASPHVGSRLELAAPDLSGREVDVAAERGRVRVVDFWASWCEPCREAMPFLDALARDLGPRGLSVYAVSFDDDREQIAAFLRETPVGFPVLWDRGGDRWSGRWQVARLPTTFVVDRKGVIRSVHDGWSATRASETRREVEKLLAERP